MKLSIVTTLYKSENFLPEFIERLARCVNSMGITYEVIFVDDGSPDKSIEVVKKFYKSLKNTKLIQLSRNFGHHEAALEGLHQAKGEYIYIIDCDLEEKPEWLKDLWAEITAQPDLDLVYCVNKTRKDNLLSKIGGKLFYKIFNLIAEVKLTPNLMTTRIMTRRFLEALKLYDEKVVFLAGIYELVGFNTKYLLKQKDPSISSRYSFWRRYKLFIKSITSFSSAPLESVFYFGILITMSSFLAAAYLVYLWFQKSLVPGWASIVVSVWLVGGIVISILGLMSIYFSTIFREVKGRPRTIVKTIENWSDHQ